MSSFPPPFKALLISTYELGRQPFGLASPAAWLERAGVDVCCADLSRESLEPRLVRQADLIAFYVPMHTATRLAVRLLPGIQELNPSACLCFYGLYAPVNEAYLRKLGASVILGGEYEAGLLETVRELCRLKSLGPDREGSREPRADQQVSPVISLARQQFLTPHRHGLPSLSSYAHLNHPDGKAGVVGYTEASRGCKHLCRHCPVVPVYQGRFRVVQRQVVLEDIQQQVEAGAEHITFGDPDFFNGIGHALAIVESLHHDHPALTYDVTIKIEHLLKHARHLTTLRKTGCLFVTSAVESIDDETLRRLDKGHTRADFLRVVEMLEAEGLGFSPTFIPFTPWTTLEGYLELLECLARLGLVEHVAPVQLGMRLLIPAGSKLLELAEVRKIASEFSEAELVYPWRHGDPKVDGLCENVQHHLERHAQDGARRAETFEKIFDLARQATGAPPQRFVGQYVPVARAAVPYLTEPWYC